MPNKLKYLKWALVHVLSRPIPPKPSQERNILRHTLEISTEGWMKVFGPEAEELMELVRQRYHELIQPLTEPSTEMVDEQVLKTHIWRTMDTIRPMMQMDLDHNN